MKELRLSSSALVHAPSIFEAVKSTYRMSDGAEKQKAVYLMASTWSVPSGAIRAAFDDDTSKVEVVVEESDVVLKLALPLAEYCLEPYDEQLVVELRTKGIVSQVEVDSVERVHKDKEPTAALALAV